MIRSIFILNHLCIVLIANAVTAFTWINIAVAVAIVAAIAAISSRHLNVSLIICPYSLIHCKFFSLVLIAFDFVLFVQVVHHSLFFLFELVVIWWTHKNGSDKHFSILFDLIGYWSGAYDTGTILCVCKIFQSTGRRPECWKSTKSLAKRKIPTTRRKLNCALNDNDSVWLR